MIQEIEKKRLFILSGGGLVGVDIHAGFLKALFEANIKPSEIIGTSAGAIVAAFVAAGYNINECIDILNKLENNDIYKERIFWQIRFPFIKYYLDNSLLKENVLKKYLADDKYGYKIPCSVIATKWNSFKTTVFSTKNLPVDISFIDCIMASTSIAGVFPLVKIKDEYYSDGCVRDNIYIPENINDYDEIYILIASINPKYRIYNDDNMIDRLKKQLDILAFDQIFDIYDKYKDNNKFKFLFFEHTINENILKFNHNLIDIAYLIAKKQIKDNHNNALAILSYYTKNR